MYTSHRFAIAAQAANAVELGICDHSNILFEGSFESIRLAALHCPERLKNLKIVHEVSNRTNRSHVAQLTPMRHSRAGLKYALSVVAPQTGRDASQRR